MYHVMVRFQSPRQFIDEAGTHSVSTQPTGGAKCSGKCEFCTGAASGSGGCAGSATYESSILSGSTIWALRRVVSNIVQSGFESRGSAKFSADIVCLQYKKASGTYELIPRLDVLAEIKNYFKKSVDTDNTIHYN